MDIETKELIKSYESLISGVRKSIEGEKGLQESIEKMEHEILVILSKL